MYKLGDEITIDGKPARVVGATASGWEPFVLVEQDGKRWWIEGETIQNTCIMRQTCATESPLTPSKH